MHTYINTFSYIYNIDIEIYWDYIHISEGNIMASSWISDCQGTTLAGTLGGSSISAACGAWRCSEHWVTIILYIILNIIYHILYYKNTIYVYYVYTQYIHHQTWKYYEIRWYTRICGCVRECLDGWVAMHVGACKSWSQQKMVQMWKQSEPTNMQNVSKCMIIQSTKITNKANIMGIRGHVQ